MDAREEPAAAVGQDHVDVAHLTVATVATELAHGLDEDEHPVHPGVRVRQSATVGVGGQRTARAEATVGDEGSALALRAEPEVFEGHQSGDGKAVVQLDDIDVGMYDTGHLHRLRAGDRRAGGGDVGHLADRHAVGVGSAGAEDVGRRLGEIAGSFCRRDDECSGAIGDEAAIELVERFGDYW